MPVTPNNIAALVAFQANEGGHMFNKAQFNPMNTTMPMPGSSVMPGSTVGVRSYTSWQQGLEATARTLENGLYGDILDNLRRSAPPDDTLRAVAHSQWGCTICANNPASALASYAYQGFPGFTNIPMPFGGTIAQVAKKMLLVTAVGAIAVGGGLLLYRVVQGKKQRETPRVLQSA
jgi:hypothetical protein